MHGWEWYIPDGRTAAGGLEGWRLSQGVDVGLVGRISRSLPLNGHKHVTPMFAGSPLSSAYRSIHSGTFPSNGSPPIPAQPSPSPPSLNNPPQCYPSLYHPLQVCPSYPRWRPHFLLNTGFILTVFFLPATLGLWGAFVFRNFWGL